MNSQEEKSGKLVAKGPQQATGEREQTGRTKEKLRENTGLLVAALEKKYGISIDFDFQQMIYSALSWTADDVAEQLAQQPTDGAPPMYDTVEQYINEVTGEPTDGALREKLSEEIAWWDHERTGTGMHHSDECKRCIVERALAAQASSDPLDKPSYRAVGGDRTAEELVRGIVKAALELACLRNNLCFEDSPPMVVEEVSEIVQDTFDAMYGIGTCSEEPCDEVLQFQRAIAESRSTTQKLQRATPDPLDKPRRD